MFVHAASSPWLHEQECWTSIAHIRTCTFIVNKQFWQRCSWQLNGNRHWQARVNSDYLWEGETVAGRFCTWASVGEWLVLPGGQCGCRWHLSNSGTNTQLFIDCASPYRLTSFFTRPHPDGGGGLPLALPIRPLRPDRDPGPPDKP